MKIKPVMFFYVLGVVLTIISLSLSMYAKPDLHLWTGFGYNFGISYQYGWLKILAMSCYVLAIIANIRERKTAH